MPRSITLRLDDEQGPLVESVARAEGTSLSAFIRMAITTQIDILRHDEAFRAKIRQQFDEHKRLLQAFEGGHELGGVDELRERHAGLRGDPCDADAHRRHESE